MKLSTSLLIRLPVCWRKSNPCAKIIQRWISDMISPSRQSPNISVSPRSSLIDRKVKICISGLEAGQPVTLHASVVGDANEIFESHAHYVANSEGKIDNSCDTSHGGSFTGCEQMGFLWSMTQAPGQRQGLRLAKKDVTKPYNIELNCFDGHLSPKEGFVNMLKENSLQPIARSSLEKFYMAEGVQRIPVREGRVRGTLFLPPGKGPFPGVIDLFGTAGGLIEFKAAILASHGFAALSLAYFAHDDLPKYLPYCELEYFEEAANWLVKHPAVMSRGIGVMGVSKGAEIALMMAAHRKDVVKAIVPISGSFVISASPFKLRGQLTGVYYDATKAKTTADGAFIFRDCLPTHELDKLDPSAIIPVEKIDCPTLLVCGEDDGSVKAAEMTQEILKRMNSHGKGALCSVLSYSGAGHLIEPPFAPHCYASYHKNFRTTFAWGGNAKDHSLAQEDSWQKILEFFSKNLGQSHNSHL
ncbi:acyl-coenzyme A thioesterase 5-like [Oculina patagonica]